MQMGPHSGQHQSQPPSQPQHQPQVTPASDERLMAMLSHLSILVSHGGIIVPILIWLLNKDKAPFAAYQAKQALFFHLAVIVLTWGIGLVTFLIAVVTFGIGLFFLFPLLAALGLLPMIYGIVGAIQSYEGRDFRYWWIGDVVKPD